MLLAADPRFTPRDASAGADARVLRSYGLQTGTYLLFPAHTQALRESSGGDRRAAGPARPPRDETRCSSAPEEAREAQPEIDAQLVKSGMGGQVRFLGYCPGRDLPALYRGAACLLFPSLFEGFGMPVLEAMASGCPVVCSNTTSLPEIAGDAALLVDPRDAEALAAALHRLLTDPDLRVDLIARGLQRAAAFSGSGAIRAGDAVATCLSRVHSQMRTI